ncbi:MAG: clostripain-related cysteine peptidase, partial [Candidatus Njordarchaeota archaeon]
MKTLMSYCRSNIHDADPSILASATIMTNNAGDFPDEGININFSDIVKISSRAKKSEWLIIYYLAMDNNLDTDISSIINSIDVAWGEHKDKNVTIILLFDSNAIQIIDGRLALWGIKIWCKNEEKLVTIFYNESIPSEINTASPKLLNKFLMWIFEEEKITAKHTVFVPISHGAGFLGIGVDYKPSETIDVLDIMDIAQFDRALSDFHFDIIVLDACLMGMWEVARRLFDNAKYIDVSSEIMYSNIRWIEEYLNVLYENININSLQFAEEITDLYFQTLDEIAGSQYSKYTDMFVIDASTLKEKSNVIDQLMLDVYLSLYRLKYDYPLVFNDFWNMLHSKPLERMGYYFDGIHDSVISKYTAYVDAYSLAMTMYEVASNLVDCGKYDSVAIEHLDFIAEKSFEIASEFLDMAVYR